MKKLNSMSHSPKIYSPMRFFQKYARDWMTLFLVFSDSVSLFLAFAIAIFIRSNMPGGLNVTGFVQLIPFLSFFIILYALRGLYNAVGLSPVNEMRLLFETTSFVYLIFMGITFWLREVELYSRLVLAFSWVFVLIFVQLDRWLTRIIARQFGAWGAPTLIAGNGTIGNGIKVFLQQNIHLGILPVIMIDGKHVPKQETIEYLKSNRLSTAILVIPEMTKRMQFYIINNDQFPFKHLILTSSLGWAGSLGATPVDLEGILGFGVSSNLLSFGQRAIKRGMDLGMVIIGGLLISPILALIAILIKLDSPGDIIYQQKRVGRTGHEFKFLKFRTMVRDADQLLPSILKADPQLKAEWDATQKLRDDPRLTRVGRILRKWSLDEFPQLFNVLRGEMSLVGPRPCFPEQKVFYGEMINLYTKVRPGMTGMWQISGRNTKTFQERVHLDEYYIRNWSPWLDIYILLRTIGVVLLQRGAY